MNSIGFIGNLGNDDSIGGQITKTRELLSAIENNCNYNNETEENKRNEVEVVDVNIYDSKLCLAKDVIKLFYNSDIIIVILASNGYFKILPFLFFLNKIYRRKIYEFVIGGVRQEFLNTRRIKLEKEITKIYVESKYMLEKYIEKGLKNVSYQPNFKRIEKIEEQLIDWRKNRQIRICTYSRIDRYKGINKAVKMVLEIINEFPDVSLEIIGPIDEDYENDFKELLANLTTENIQYKGVINGNKSTEMLKEYDILLFPTEWEAEGFPGSFIDAMASGLAILASDRINFRDVIHNGVNGYLIEEGNEEAYISYIKYWINNREELCEIQKKSLYESDKYLEREVLRGFFSEIT